MIRMIAVGIIGCAVGLSSLAHAASPSNDEIAQKHHITIEDVQRLHSYRGLTNNDLKEMSTGKVRSILWKLDNPKPDQPLGAAEFRQMQQSGGLGIVVPENALGTAVQELESIRAEIERRAPTAAAEFSPEETRLGRAITTVAGVPIGEMEFAVPVPAPGVAQPNRDPRQGLLELDLEALQPVEPAAAPALQPAPGGISPSNWKWLGPGNVGGRTRALVIHPDQPDIMWAGAVAGGVWKTVDAGQSWAPLADFMANLNVSTLLLHPRDPNMLFAGTGEGFYNLDAFRGAGIFRSSDGGATWQQMPETANAKFHFVNRLASTADAETMLAATRNGIFRSTNYDEDDLATISFSAGTGISGLDILDIDCHPTDVKKCVAGGRGNVTYFTEDGGSSWSASSGIPDANLAERFFGRVEVAYALGDASVVYASVDRRGGEIYRSQDGGKTFMLRHSGSKYLSGQGWYNNALWAGDPQRPDLVVVGGLDLYRSTDGGRTLQRISEWWRVPNSAHADHHAIVSHPNYNGTTNRQVYFANDGGIYVNRDLLTAGLVTGWVSLNNKYGVTQFYSAAGNLSSGRIVAGAQDNGTQVYRPEEGANGYASMFGGDGGYSAADPNDPNFLYGEYVYLQIHRSVDGGRSSQYVFDGIGEAGSGSGALFIAPFILDPADANTMLAGGRSLWRSTNIKASTPSWEAIKPAIGPSSMISAIEARRNGASGVGSDVIWVGHQDGQVFKTVNGDSEAPSWQRVDATPQAGLPDRFVTRIRVDPENTKIAFVMFGGYAPGNVWKTTDSGGTWRNIGTKLPEVTIYDLAIHPRDSKLLYLATEVGVFASADAGDTWWPTNQGPANVTVNELFWMGETLIAVTHGRGLFWIDLSQSVVVAGGPADALAEPAGVSTPPATPEGLRTYVVPVSPFNSR